MLIESPNMEFVDREDIGELGVELVRNEKAEG